MSTPVQVSRPVQARRSRWWIVHHWAGVKLGLLLTFVLLTGTVATISNEIDWMVRPALRVTPQDAPMASPALWYAAALRVPGFTIEEVRAPIEAGFATQIEGTGADGEERIVYVDPWTGGVRGSGSADTVQSVVRDLHRALMLPTGVGVTFVSLLSVPLLLTLITAFKIYKRWWRGFRRLPRPMRDRRGEGRRWTGDLHRLAGVWSLWFVALIGATGAWYLAEKLGAGTEEARPPAASRAEAVPTPYEVQQMIATARSVWPGFALKGLVIDEGTVALEGQGQALLVRDRANVLWFDTASGKLSKRADATSLGALGRLSEAADPLHFGNWGGLASKIVWFAFGLILVALCVSGLVICALRLRSGGGALAALARSMGAGAVLSIALVAYAIAKLACS